MTPDEFVEKARIDAVKAEKNIITYVSTENTRCEKGEITAAAPKRNPPPAEKIIS